MRQRFPLDWRTQHRGKKRFYARYMRWLERGGYLVVAVILAAFIFAFTYPMEDALTAEKVEIEPLAVPVKATEPTLIVEFLVENGVDVQRGAPIARVVTGESGVASYLASRALLGTGIKAELPPVNIEQIDAPSAGTVLVDMGQLDKRLEPESELFKVVDYNDLRLSASLSGTTVAQAKVGGPATVGPVTISPATGVLVRGRAGRQTVISGDLIGSDIREEATKKLTNLHLKPRDDLELSIQEVTELLLDADFETKSVGASAVLSEPDSNAVFSGEVVLGSHRAIVQLSDLPPDVAQALSETIREKLRARTIGIAPQTALEISDVKNLRIVAKAKAGVAETPTGATLPATALSRTFDAQVKLVNPPPHLVSLVKLAHAQGRGVTARVKVRTGQRPLAFLLLKRS